MAHSSPRHHGETETKHGQVGRMVMALETGAFHQTFWQALLNVTLISLAGHPAAF